MLIARQLQLPEAEVASSGSARCCTTSARSASPTTSCRSPDRCRRTSSSRSSAIPRSARASCARCRSSSLTSPIVELHHERPDGNGYPFGLRGDDIPLAARIVHVADAFDAMTSARAYRPARAASAALVELQLYAGTQFDSASVDALREALAQSTSAPERRLQALLGREASA